MIARGDVLRGADVCRLENDNQYGRGPSKFRLRPVSRHLPPRTQDVKRSITRGAVNGWMGAIVIDVTRDIAFQIDDQFDAQFKGWIKTSYAVAESASAVANDAAAKAVATAVEESSAGFVSDEEGHKAEKEEKSSAKVEAAQSRAARLFRRLPAALKVEHRMGEYDATQVKQIIMDSIDSDVRYIRTEAKAKAKRTVSKTVYVKLRNAKTLVIPLFIGTPDVLSHATRIAPLCL